MIGLALGLAFLGGVVSYDLGVFTLAGVTAAIAAALVAAGSSKARVRLASALVVACLLAGAGRVATAAGPQELPGEVIGASNFTGTVVSLPRLYPERTDVELRLRTPVEATVLAHLPPTIPVRQGDVLSGVGRLEVRRPAGLSSNSSMVLSVYRSSVVGNTSTPAQRLRTRIRESIGERLLRSIPEPAGTLSLGVLLGDDSGMTPPTRQAFQTAGLTHLTAVSGWNVAVVAGIGELALRRWTALRVRLLVLTAIIWVYAYLVGLQPPVTRAALMGSLYLAARWRGRPREPLTALVWSVIAMVVVTPEIRFDVAFQLSALSTASLALLSPHLGRYPAWLGALAVPVVAQLAAMPLLLYRFGAYSLVAPVANVLAGPAVALVLAGSVLVVVGSFVHPVVAEALGVLAWLPARWIVWIAELAASWPGLAGRAPAPDGRTTVLFYLGMAIPALWWWQRATAVPLPEGLSLLVPEAAELPGDRWSVGRGP